MIAIQVCNTFGGGHYFTPDEVLHCSGSPWWKIILIVFVVLTVGEFIHTLFFGTGDDQETPAPNRSIMPYVNENYEIVDETMRFRKGDDVIVDNGERQVRSKATRNVTISRIRR